MQVVPARVETPILDVRGFSILPTWSETDALIVSSFFASPSGQSLRLRMQGMIAAVCIAGCQSENNTLYAAAVGAGWDECWRKVLEHGDAARFHALQEFTRGGAAVTGPQNAGTAEGEPGSREGSVDAEFEALLNRLSP